ncbi:hypothetical protein F2Q70_00023552 [Brassica cretica]|uniref:Uncharacterized protein n=1 Tax=Brassica cretica TaxID=69181 RepID=A0A8S9GPP0_BRACR|nr:hypothetical protein F2Q70_00023552 [Brassica cretica]
MDLQRNCCGDAALCHCYENLFYVVYGREGHLLADPSFFRPDVETLQNFKIGDERERMPEPIVCAFGVLKKCVAKHSYNHRFFLSHAHCRCNRD